MHYHPQCTRCSHKSPKKLEAAFAAKKDKGTNITLHYKNCMFRSWLSLCSVKITMLSIKSLPTPHLRFLTEKENGFKIKSRTQNRL